MLFRSEISLFLQMMSLAMVNQPGWVEQLAGRLQGVLPIRRGQLLKLSARVYLAARKQQLAASKGRSEVSLEEIMRPLREAASQPVPRMRQ